MKFEEELDINFGTSTNEEQFSDKASSIYEKEMEKQMSKETSESYDIFSTPINKSSEAMSFETSSIDFDSLDLNEYVEQIINAKPIQGLIEEGVEIDSETLAQLQMNKRKRKSKEQLDQLMVEYRRNPSWTKEDMKILAAQLGMSLSQVYKWQWDQKKKENGTAVPAKRSKKSKKTSRRKN